MSFGRSRRFRTFIATISSLVIISAILLIFYGRTQLQPVSETHGTSQTIQVAAHENVQTLAAELEKRHLIKSAFWFSLYANFKGLNGQLQPGTYNVDAGMGVSAIVAVFSANNGASSATHLTLAEGLTAAQMANKIQASGLHISSQDYLAEATAAHFNTQALLGTQIQGSLEGLLFPDTYDFASNTSAHDVVQVQLNTFAQKVTASGVLQRSTLTPYQVLILASIVDREARFDVDRPLVASVLMNRLARGMDLQVDASVMYGLGITDRSPTLSELQQDTPFNTYMHSGLPPAPIANPGLASIDAAAQPANTDYLFYVSDCQGHIHYSVTAAQHDQQVNQYVGAC